MAFFNEIGAGRYNRLIQKLFNMKGGPPARQLASDVAMVMPFFAGAELRYLEGWNRFGQVATTVASVGNISQLRLRNPTGSNVIAVIEKIFVFNLGGAADQPVLSQGAVLGDLGNIITPTNMRLDPRGNPQPALIFSQTQGATGALAVNLWSLPLAVGQTAECIVTDIQEFPRLPGDGIHYQSGLTNQQCSMAVWWRERALEDSEIK